MKSAVIEATLAELCLLVTDGTHDSPKILESGVPFIKGKHISSGRIDFANCDYISEADHAECIRRVKPQAGDILMSNIGSIGDTAWVPDSVEFSIKNVALLRPDPERVDNRYLFLLFKNPAFLKEVLNLKAGAAQQYISLAALRGHKVSIIQDLPTQQRIAGILSAYDDLIENNRRRIGLLEQAARLLYREWFVHLRFPGHETAKIVDGLPEGWERKRIGDITTKLGSGATPRGGESAYEPTGMTLIRSLNIYDFSFHDDGLAFINQDQAKKLANVAVESQDVLINITGASVARCCMVPERHLPARVNQHVMIVRVDPQKASPFFVLHSINSHQNKERLLSIARAGGATREAITKDTMSGFEILRAPQDLVGEFHMKCAAMHEQSERLSAQNAKLTRARHLLLPRLMDGRIPV